MFPDPFKPDLFTTTALTASINKVPYVPSVIGGMGIFAEQGVPTTSIVVERKSGILTLVPTSRRGAAGATRSVEKAKAIIVQIPHLSVDDALYADSVQGVREFGSADQTRAVETQRDAQLEIASRDLDFTLEYHRLGAAQGIVLDADGATTILNVFTAFNISQPAEIDFDLDAASPASGALMLKCNQVVRGVTDALGNFTPAAITGFCGDTFFDQLVAHPEARETYKYQAEAPQLRESRVYRTFRFGDIDFVNYRGSGAVAIGATKCKFVARGVPDLFITRFGPADYIETVNTIGLPKYAKAEPMKFGKGIEMQSQSNPINLCTLPESLYSARNT